MATTSISLGEHWEQFIKSEVNTGRYGSACEVIRDALRHLESQQQKLDAFLRPRIESAENGYLSTKSIDDIANEVIQENHND